MGKGKNNGRGGCGGGGGGGGEGGEMKDDKSGGGGGGTLNIVLKMDLHCDGCTKRIRNSILKFPGVFNVEFEGENKVKIMAHNKVDPVKLRERLQKKTLKKTELISPQPSKNNDKKNENNKDDKPKELPVTTVLLKVAYHCDGCGGRLYKAISSYKGVHEVSIEKEKDRVKVTGRIEAKKMAEELQKKLKKTVEIANDKKEKENGKKGGGDQKENGGGGGGGGGGGEKKEMKLEYIVNGSGYIGIVNGTGRVVEIFDTPQFFSDDNPNACSVM